MVLFIPEGIKKPFIFPLFLQIESNLTELLGVIKPILDYLFLKQKSLLEKNRIIENHIERQF